MTNGTEETWARFKARIAGAFYLLNVLTAIVAASVAHKLIVSSHAAGTSASILAHEPVFRWACAVGLIAASSYVIVTALLYSLFKPVNRTISLPAAFLSLLGCAIGVLDTLSHLASLIVLKGGGYLGVFRVTVQLLTGADYFRVFDVRRLAALGQFFLNLEGSGLEIGFVFLGLGSTVLACAWLKSRYIPRRLAALGIFGSAVFTILTLVLMVSPVWSASWQ